MGLVDREDDERDRRSASCSREGRCSRRRGGDDVLGSGRRLTKSGVRNWSSFDCTSTTFPSRHRPGPLPLSHGRRLVVVQRRRCCTGGPHSWSARAEHSDVRLYVGWVGATERSLWAAWQTSSTRSGRRLASRRCRNSGFKREPRCASSTRSGRSSRILTYTAEPGSKSEQALNLLASWTATLDQAEPATVTAEA
jgi:hypothetical protein